MPVPQITGLPSSRLLRPSRPLTIFVVGLAVGISVCGAQVLEPEWVAYDGLGGAVSRAAHVVEGTRGDIFFTEEVKAAGTQIRTVDLVGLRPDGTTFARVRLLPSAAGSVEAFALERGGGDTLVVGLREGTSTGRGGRAYLLPVVAGVGGPRPAPAVPLPLLDAQSATDGPLPPLRIYPNPGRGQYLLARDDVDGSARTLSLLDRRGAVLREAVFAGAPATWPTSQVLPLGGVAYLKGFGAGLTWIRLSDFATDTMALPSAARDGGEHTVLASMRNVSVRDTVIDGEVVQDSTVWMTAFAVVAEGHWDIGVYQLSANRKTRVEHFSYVSADPYGVRLDADTLTILGRLDDRDQVYWRARASGDAGITYLDFPLARHLDRERDNFELTAHGDLLLASAAHVAPGEPPRSGALVLRQGARARRGERLYDESAPYVAPPIRSVRALRAYDDGSVKLLRLEDGGSIVTYEPGGARREELDLALPERLGQLGKAAFGSDGSLVLLQLDAATGTPALHRLDASGRLTHSFALPPTDNYRLVPNNQQLLEVRDDGAATALINLYESPAGHRQLLLRLDTDFRLRDSTSFASREAGYTRQSVLLADDAGVVQSGGFPDGSGGAVFATVRVDDRGVERWRYTFGGEGESVGFVRTDASPDGQRVSVLCLLGEPAVLTRVVIGAGGEELSRTPYTLPPGAHLSSDHNEGFPAGLVSLRVEESDVAGGQTQRTSYLARIDTVAKAIVPTAVLPEGNAFRWHYAASNARRFVAGTFFYADPVASGFGTVLATFADGLSRLPESASAKTRPARAYPNPAAPGQTIRLSIAEIAGAVEVYDALGRRVAEVPSYGGLVELPGLVSGAYRLTGETARGERFAAAVVVR